MMKADTKKIATLFLALGLTAGTAFAQGSMEQSASRAQADLEAALKELSQLREKIAGEKLPLTRKLSKLESELIQIRKNFQDAGRDFDKKTLDLTNLQKEIKGRHEEKAYLSSLFDEYVRNLETRVHITELQRYREAIEQARNAPDNGNLTPAEIFGKQVATIELSVDRLLDLSGGATFDGTAVDMETGVVKDVTFALVGPVAYYAANDGSSAGLAEQRLNSFEPNMIALPAHKEKIATLIAGGAGTMPFDATLGNAQKVAETKDTLGEHIAKGGVMMFPILTLAAAAFIVVLFKWAQISLVPKAARKHVEKVLALVKNRDYLAAKAKAKDLKGPTGEMLGVGVENLHEPKQLVEELMFEKMLDTRLKLQSMLPFVAVAAAAAPLMGLLGTVIGIINTFKLITLHGTGDPKTLSSGISEALITTEFGLIVAIPSLLLHAFLSRKVRRFIDGMEKDAVSLLNRIAPSGMSHQHINRPADAAISSHLPNLAPPIPATEGLDH